MYQGTLDPAELVVPRLGELSAAPDSIGELLKGERQQRQGLTGLGLGNKTIYQALIYANPC
jgi:hypothetical protein